MSKHMKRITKLLITVGVASLLMMVAAGGVLAQDEETPEEPATTTEEVIETAMTLEDVNAGVETVQFNLDMTWLLLAGFLVFFMQAGFAMLEGGFIRQTGVVNSLAENFMDACVTALVFFVIGYGIAYGASEAEYALFGTPTLALGGINGTADGDGLAFVDWFFQFAFAGAAGTIVTGATAERMNFVGKLFYSAMLAFIIYPVVVFWTWGGGWLTANGFIDFAGSTIVHQTGGVVGLVAAAIIGPRAGRVFGEPPSPSNYGLAAMGTFILWFGWYGFNVGSTLSASDPNIMGLVATNTTLSAAAAAISAMLYVYFTKGGKWDLTYILNGSLAGLVGITAGCAFVAPFAAIIIGLTAGVVVVLAVDAVEAAKIDDAVGAFAVHGACGMLGSLAIGFWGLEGLGAGAGGLFTGGGIALLLDQLLGVVAVTVWAGVTATILFTAMKAIGILRIPAKADEMGIDAYEHGASVWPDVLPVGSEAPAAGD